MSQAFNMFESCRRIRDRDIENEHVTLQMVKTWRCAHTIARRVRHTLAANPASADELAVS
jgi:hypothetical protein